MGVDRWYESQTDRIYGENDLEKLQKVFDMIGVKYRIIHHKGDDRQPEHYELHLKDYYFYFWDDKKIDQSSCSYKK